MKKIAIIGGGAAGLAAAVAAGFSGTSGIKITVFEATDRVGRPILASGNGRCNFSNANIDTSQYHNSEFAVEALAAFEEIIDRKSSQFNVLLRTNVSRETFYEGKAPGSADQFVRQRDRDVSRETFCGGFNIHSAPNGVVAFFERLGLLWREEGEGRLYPKANKASTVLEVLRNATAAFGVEIRTEARVERVELPRTANGQFTLRLANGVFERADAVIVACGGSVAQELLPESFAFIPQRPVLGPMATDTRWVKQLNNIRVKCAIELRRGMGKSARCGDASRVDADIDSGVDKGIRVCDIISSTDGNVGFSGAGGSSFSGVDTSSDVDSNMGFSSADAPGNTGYRTVARETGEVLFRKYGVSGIAAFNLSRLAQPGDTVVIDLFPDVSLQHLEESFVQRLSMLKANIREDITRSDFLCGAHLPQVSHVLLEYAGLNEDALCTVQDISAIAYVCKNFKLEYHGIGDAAQCQVHRGGFASQEGFSGKTLQAVDVPGLFAVGEALDIDGPCGGYNLHWAFASGVLAGTNAVAVCS